MIALVKAVHIAGLALWCAGLLALPVLLRVYGHPDHAHTQAGFAALRRLTHRLYTMVVTPAAILAVAAGTVLIFPLVPLEGWLILKLLAVAGMVLVHAWLGHLIVQTGAGGGQYLLPSPMIALALMVPLMVLVLVLVLAKPEIAPLIEGLPEMLRNPYGRELPSGLVPI